MIIKSKQSTQQGFTIIELLTSTVIFSLVLLAAMAGLVQIGRLYYKGITTSRTQEAARNVISEVSQSIQFSRQPVTTTGMATSGGPEVAAGDSGGRGFFCVGPRRYSYTVDRKLVNSASIGAKESRHVLWVDTPNGGCAQNPAVSIANLTAADPCSTGTCSEGRELLNENMRVSRLTLVQSGAVWTIDLGVAFGDDDTQEDGPLRLSDDNSRRICLGSTFSVQFCAISELRTSVTRRL